MGATGHIGILTAVFLGAGKGVVDKPIAECAEESPQSGSFLWSASIFPSTVKKITGVFGVPKEEFKALEEGAGLVVEATAAPRDGMQ